MLSPSWCSHMISNYIRLRCNHFQLCNNNNPNIKQNKKKKTEFFNDRSQLKPKHYSHNGFNQMQIKQRKRLLLFLLDLATDEMIETEDGTSLKDPVFDKMVESDAEHPLNKRRPVG